MITWFSSLFIANYEWHESYGKLLGEAHFCSPGSGCLKVDTGTVSCYNRGYYNSGFNSHLLFFWAAADSDGKAKWLDAATDARAWARVAQVLATPLHSIIEYNNVILGTIAHTKIERIQCKATRMAPSISQLHGVSCHDRMKHLNLPSLQYHRWRGDLI